MEATPDGEVRYHVIVDGTQSRIESGSAAQPDVTFTSDYPTAAAIARGELSTQAALMEGRIRVRGDMARMVERPPLLAGIDPLPASLRAETTY